MKIELGISREVDKILIADDTARSAEHISSGGLTPSSLGASSLEWLLKYLNVPKKPTDPYTLRKFARGRAVEDWYVDKIKTAGLLRDTQKEINYRGLHGFADAIVDHKNLDFKVGIIPHEVKSVTGMHFKRIKTTGVINHNYCLQGGAYALATEANQFCVDVIASDDLRDLSIVFDTADFKHEIDQTINLYQKMVEDWNKGMIIPKFAPKEKWQANPMYQNWEEKWYTFSQGEFINELKKLKLV